MSENFMFHNAFVKVTLPGKPPVTKVVFSDQTELINEAKAKQCNASFKTFITVASGGKILKYKYSGQQAFVEAPSPDYPCIIRIALTGTGIRISVPDGIPPPGQPIVYTDYPFTLTP
ncbi:hypothetical protein CPB83DRAFT_842596 [Crepidotus variabilis]|uniref:Uncharacterized protein n=1 Tax=Crepidotus variabilis TaxID=179855 RepID=A0A9P6JW59_9AGAR|nr:hypothetical protein CPB83DRAFT_842596 [Crepidotus variabilis]